MHHPNSQFVARRLIKNVFLFVCVTQIFACASTSEQAVNSKTADAVKTSLPAVPDDWSSNAETGTATAIDWLSKLDAPELQALVDEAQNNNRNLRATVAQVEKARALSKQASAALSPQVAGTLGGERAGQGSGGSDGILNVGVQASWELDVWGRISSSKRVTAENLKAAEADLRYARHSLAAAVSQAYFLVVEANQQLSLSQKSIDALRRQQGIVKLMFDNGSGDQQDLSLARSDLENARSELIAGEGARRNAIRALELLLGRYPKAKLATLMDLPAAPRPPAAGLPSEMLERRPDLVAAERRVAAAFNAVDAAKAAKLPSITLNAVLGGGSNSLGSLLDSSNIAWKAVSSLVAPLIDGGRLDAEVEAATADQKLAVALYAESALTAFGEVETALDQSQVLERQRDAVEKSLAEAENALRIANLQFAEGEIGLLDVLTIQQRVFQSRRALLSIKRTELDQFIRLNLALGGAWQ